MKLTKPKFWDKKNKTLFAYLLYPLSIITKLINFTKNLSKKNKKNIKTICVGNIYIGGTGKTPLAIKINQLLKEKYKTVFIKKKYLDHFDEEQLLKNNGELITKNKRIDCLNEATEKGFELAIFDDGLQDKKIPYDVSIVCFNSELGIGNGMVIPSGPLREDLNNLKNYNIAMINGFEKNINLINLIKNINENIKIYDCKYVPKNLENYDLKKKYLSFSGIGNSNSFDNILKLYKFNVVEKIHYPDHYNFSEKEIISIKKKAIDKGLSIITTEKDFFRLNDEQKSNINFLKIELVLNNEQNFINHLII